MTTPCPLVLASSSRYRRALLERFGLPFECSAPDIDEAPQGDETPSALALRLAETKARAVARQRPGALVIGSDQVAQLDGALLGKPGDAATARDQLARASGREVEFLTAVALVDGRNGAVLRHVDRTVVQFRPLDPAEIAAYVERDRPLDCAGSFRSEGLGVVLFERISSEDPTALVGLPLIALARMMRQAGIEII
jgi:septum formation protein